MKAGSLEGRASCPAAPGIATSKSRRAIRIRVAQTAWQTQQTKRAEQVSASAAALLSRGSQVRILPGALFCEIRSENPGLGLPSQSVVLSDSLKTRVADRVALKTACGIGDERDNLRRD